MKKRDLDKIVNAGFCIFRIDYERLCIKIRSGNSAWKTLEKSGSRAALVSRYEQLLEHPKNIEA